MINICYCGSQDGYPHADWCPRPLYHATYRETEQWMREAGLLPAPAVALTDDPKDAPALPLNSDTNCACE